MNWKSWRIVILQRRGPTKRFLDSLKTAFLFYHSLWTSYFVLCKCTKAFESASLKL